MKCGTCGEDIPVESECVACCMCMLKFHFDCSVREIKWRNMTGDQKNKWTCVKCKSSANLSRSNSASSNLSEVGNSCVAEDETSTRALLVKMNSRLDTLDEVKTLVDTMSKSLGFLSGKYDELLTEVKNYKEENKKLVKEVALLKTDATRKDQELSILSKRFNALEQYGRGVNLEMHGIEETGYETSQSILEKTAAALGLTYNPSVIQAAHRVPSRDKQKVPMFLVQFTNKAVKQQWLQLGRKKKLHSKDIVGEGDGRIYFNENLTPYYSKLFKETKTEAKKKGYEFVWLLNGSIRVKKQELSRQTFIISCYEDLQKLV